MYMSVMSMSYCALHVKRECVKCFLAGTCSLLLHRILFTEDATMECSNTEAPLSLMN